MNESVYFFLALSIIMLITFNLPSSINYILCPYYAKTTAHLVQSFSLGPSELSNMYLALI